MRTWSVTLYYKNGANDCIENIALKMARRIARSHGQSNVSSVKFVLGGKRRTMGEKIFYSGDYPNRYVIARITLDKTKKKLFPLSKLWTTEIKALELKPNPDSE